MAQQAKVLVLSCCGVGLIPGLRTSTYLGHGTPPQKKDREMISTSPRLWSTHIGSLASISHLCNGSDIITAPRAVERPHEWVPVPGHMLWVSMRRHREAASVTVSGRVPAQCGGHSWYSLVSGR